MVCVCALFSLTGCYNTEPRENVLKIYNWADYIDAVSYTHLFLCRQRSQKGRI